MNDVTNVKMSAAGQSPLSCLEAALSYAERGWHVLPLHWIVDGRCSCGKASCKSPAKHPLTKHGVLDATIDEATIRNWWKKWSHANVGIRTGEASKIFVIDTDGEKGQETWRSVKSDKPLSKKEFLVATTGREGGAHLFFKWPEGHVDIGSWSDREKKIDVRANGGYVVAAPSMHLSGRAYKFVTPLALTQNCPRAPSGSWTSPSAAMKRVEPSLA